MSEAAAVLEKKPKRRGRPPGQGKPIVYTSKLAGIVCERVSKGESLKTICEDAAMPQARSVYQWLEENKDFRHNYALSVNERAAAIFEETLEIADDGRNDWMEKLGSDDTPLGWTLNGEHVNRSRLRVDTRKWFLSRMDPKKYGDRVALANDQDNPLTDPAAAARRQEITNSLLSALAHRLGPAPASPPMMVDVTPKQIEAPAANKPGALRDAMMKKLNGHRSGG